MKEVTQAFMKILMNMNLSEKTIKAIMQLFLGIYQQMDEIGE